MNQKSFAIFVGAIMILSAFAGFVLRGDQSSPAIAAESVSLETFGVQGRMVDWSFESLGDVLEMSPSRTVMAYWINLSAPQNLTDASRAAMPQSLGLKYGSELYPNPIEKIAAAYFNNTWAEFHWVRPFRVTYNGLVVPYENYMMIPTTTDYVTVMGRPTLFGNQEAMKEVLDVISGGGLPADKFTLPAGEKADLQVAALGKGAAGSLLPGGYQEFYLGVSASGQGEGSSYNITARYLQPDGSAAEKAKEIASRFGLAYTTSTSGIAVSGSVSAKNLQGVLEAFLKP
jgi:hypothetical protein